MASFLSPIYSQLRHQKLTVSLFQRGHVFIQLLVALWFASGLIAH